MKKIKICGLYRDEDINIINEYLPDYCGFIINFPKSHRNISIEKLKALRERLDKKVIPVGVFVDHSPKVIADLLNENVISIAQLHGIENDEYIKDLKKMTDKTIWKAFQINSDEDVKAANKSIADFVILDAGQVTGKTFNWKYLNKINREYGLAGGLNLNNLDDALLTDAVLLDVSGGVESEKIKDKNKIKEFIKRTRG